jgi:RNA polymerase sigma-70 factor (ECF subfamily)
VLATERRDRVRSAVEKLTPDLRMVTVLRYTEGMSYEQISEVLGCSTGTVASRLNRAHKALERRLTHFVNQQGGRHV